MKLRPALTCLALVALAVLLLLPANARAAALAGLDDTCLETELKGCTVLKSGYLTLMNGGKVAFQTQDGFTDADGVLNGVVLFEAAADGGWSLFASAFDGYGYDVRLVEHEQTMLHVSGYTGGTGSYNTDRLFVWGDLGHAEGWAEIDLSQWLGTIADLLPPGLEIWKGVDYDFDDWFYGELNARTPLWRADDGNCCPGGGWATIHFAIDNGALVATTVDYQPPAKAK
jgi:hypothetical protein